MPSAWESIPGGQLARGDESSAARIVMRVEGDKMSRNDGGSNYAAEQVSKTLTILGPTGARGDESPTTVVVRTSKSRRESRKVHGT
jgi:hypothetical protein